MNANRDVMKKEILVAAKISRDDYDAMAKEARILDRPISWLVRRALVRFIENGLQSKQG